jgi:hypothetical protein
VSAPKLYNYGRLNHQTTSLEYQQQAFVKQGLRDSICVAFGIITKQSREEAQVSI